MITIALIVFTFSIVQSFFGVGVLVFGTPTCLLLGYPFEVTLSYLLPASIGISCLQIFHGRKDIKLKKEFLVFTVPFIILGLSLVLIKWPNIDMKFVVGFMLILTSSSRLFLKNLTIMDMENFLKKKLNVYLISMGFIHGFSNMGGGLLTILVSSLFKDKKAIRANIAYGYLIFAITQIMVLAILRPYLFSINIVIFPFISIITYILLGNVIFLRLKEAIYQRLITLFIFVYGIVLLFA